MWKKSMPQAPTTSLLLAALVLTGFVDYAKADFNYPTYSSPIALSADNKLIWSVNPDDDSVSVIRTDTNQVITKIGVGDEPQSVALNPDNRYAYIANAATGTVTAIGIKNPDPNDFEARVSRVGLFGAHPAGAG